MMEVQTGEKVRVYVAGPLTAGKTLKNIPNAIKVGNDLLERGFVPFIPHLNVFWEFIYPHHPDSVWLAYDKQWLGVCHALLRLPGESPGADGEVDFAAERDIPVFYHISDLEEHFFSGG